MAYGGTALRDAHGRGVGLLCVIDTAPHIWTKEDEASLRDLAALVITEMDLRTAVQEAQSRAEEAERERWQKSALLESTIEGIYGLDTNGNCTFINEAGAKMLKYAPYELIGEYLHAII